MQTFPGATPANRVRLLQGPYRYQFTYAQKGAGARQWRNTWPFPTRIPDLIRLEIIDKRRDVLISPPMIVAIAADAELSCLSEKAKVCSPKSGGDLAGGARREEKDEERTRQGRREGEEPMNSPKRALVMDIRARSGERGLALLIVLWIIVAASLVVSAFNATVRSGTTLASSEVQLARSEALLDAGAEIAVSRLIDEEKSRRWRPDGKSHVVPFEDAELIISIRDANGLIDINKADKELLLRFLRQFAGSESNAVRLRDRIVQARGKGAVEKPADAQRRTDDGEYR